VEVILFRAERRVPHLGPLCCGRARHCRLAWRQLARGHGEPTACRSEGEHCVCRAAKPNGSAVVGDDSGNSGFVCGQNGSRGATNWISGAVVPSQVAEALPLRLAEEGVFGEHSCIESGIVVRPLQAVLNVDLQRDLVLWLRSGPSFSNCVRVQGSSPARRRPGWGAVLRRLTQLLRSRSRGMA
jgi:hypothetical protein